jgi:putative effector of murein hydrolase LrgA (UPF0299 family)
MEVPRKIGIGILMIVPAFVGAGALWDLFHHSWLPIIGWIILMALCTGAIISEKLSRT